MCFREEIPPGNEFMEVNAHQMVLRLVTKVSGRVFIGPELNHTEEYIQAASGYTMDLIKAARAINKIKPWMRWFKAPSLPEVDALEKRLNTAVGFIGPVVAARENSAEKDAHWQRPDDLLQWIIDDHDKFGEHGVEKLATVQLGITFAAVNTTTFTTANALYNIASMPGLVPELREEMKSVLAEYGTFTAPALQKLKKLDSFIRETMRFHPFALSEEPTSTNCCFLVRTAHETDLFLHIQLRSLEAS